MLVQGRITSLVGLKFEHKRLVLSLTSKIHNNNLTNMFMPSKLSGRNSYIYSLYSAHFILKERKLCSWSPMNAVNWTEHKWKFIRTISVVFRISDQQENYFLHFAIFCFDEFLHQISSEEAWIIDRLTNKIQSKKRTLAFIPTLDSFFNQFYVAWLVINSCPSKIFLNLKDLRTHISTVLASCRNVGRA